MFWQLLLAHLIADYPLQWNWLLEAKGRWRGLLIHATILFAVMLILVGPESWPALLLLAIVHLLIDRAKYLLSLRWPTYVVSAYVVDQAVHLLSILAFAQILTRATGPAVAPEWVIYAVGYLIVTYVWSISERVIAHSDPAYLAELSRQFWPRQMLRALMLTGLVLLVPVAALAAVPYLSSSSGRRAIFTDLCVVLAARVVIQIGA